MFLEIWDGEVFTFILVEYNAYWNVGLGWKHYYHILNTFFVILIYLYLILFCLFSSILPWNE